MKKGLCIAIAAVLLCIVIAFAQESVPLKLGDSGDAVLALNTRLRQLNYTTVRAGSDYNAATQTAVSAVQAAYQLPVTGQADAQTLAVIYGTCYRPLSYGDNGQDVSLLQEKLFELGYYRGTASGNYLEATAAAVQQFQMENSITVTGKADVHTQEMLYRTIKRPTPTPSPIPTSTPVPAPTPTLGPYQAFQSELKYGSTGNNVQRVQQRLKDLGYFTYYKTTTGYYKNTQTAVEAFQKNNGLKVSGNVDKETWNLLFNDETVVDASCTPHPTRTAAPPEYFFEVDVNNQVVKVWKYNKEKQDYCDLDRAFLCATGTTTYPSPLGTFTLSGRRSAHAKFPKWGGGEARYWTKITEDIAFHSVLYTDSSNLMTLKEASFTGLGKRGSHGCIRLTLADAKWIYENAEEGMQVWIHESAKSDPELRYAIQPGKLNRDTMLPRTTPPPPTYSYDGTQTPQGEMRSLSVGKEGQDVYWLQVKLKELGFYTGTATGQYREGTERAVNAYQRARGLTIDGRAGVQTLTYLYKEVQAANITPAPTIQPTQSIAPITTNSPLQNNH